MHISRLFIYPVKSCAPVEVDRIDFDRFGPIGDRRYLVVDQNGGFLTQREITDMAYIQPELTATGIRLSGIGPKSEAPVIEIPYVDSPLRSSVTVWRDQMEATDCGEEAAAWLSDFLGQACRLVTMPPDHNRPVRRENLSVVPEGTQVVYADGAPLLVVTEESLEALSDRAGMDIEVQRFRPNVVLKGAPAAFEERHWTHLKVGWKRLPLTLIFPCERCVVPTRDPATMTRTPEVTQALVALCRTEGKIYFGQNALFAGSHLKTGQKVSVSD